MSIYDFTIKTRKGEDVSLTDYKDKVLLIVNTATGCGFTPQYEGLENLYKKYHESGGASFRANVPIRRCISILYALKNLKAYALTYTENYPLCEACYCK